MKSGVTKSTLAFYVQDFVGWSFASKSLEYATTNNVKHIGFTGGVAFNEIILNSFCKTIKNSGKKLNILAHKSISPGDGGISGGQVVLLAKRLGIS